MHSVNGQGAAVTQFRQGTEGFDKSGGSGVDLTAWIFVGCPLRRYPFQECYQWSKDIMISGQLYSRISTFGNECVQG